MKQQQYFYHFLFREKVNKQLLTIGLLTGVGYLLLLRVLFPFPSFYADSYTYLDAAAEQQPISFRPIQYSEFISFFHNFSTSDLPLIAGQYFSAVLANLFLFFTCTYLFKLPGFLKKIVFALLVFNPLYLLTANFVLSDSFFCSLTTAWIACLIWIIYKPGIANILGQLILLLLLFKLRYNALIFPCFTTLALIFSKQNVWIKTGVAIASFGILFILMDKISDTTQKLTGTRTFSAFSGWQMASNAIHVLRNQPADTTNFDSEQRTINHFVINYLIDKDSLKVKEEEVTASYIWDRQSPLKQYLNYYASLDNYTDTYFETWTALGPVYNTFGAAVIQQQPLAYIRYFVWPNTKRYFFPVMEAYEQFNEGRDSVDKLAARFYNYQSTNIDNRHASLHIAALAPWKYLFPVVNTAFILLSLLYLITGRYRRQSRLFNQVLLTVTAFYLGNLCFVSAVAPNVFRYHLFVITLLLVFGTYLGYLLANKKADVS
ncbi:hypothetical protein HNQ91_004912 [Filimonas zeae]|uniref:Uncharacterized protein n=1 Tax=Filimonas zeae TaxID=1737353 RepID=A0A917MYQ1_9BACT|nr:hypothetical protein [Filimonas zeae]MDR6341835.1 hypothetical protein [Filimonas zeae]GGH80148.1 hypothetical protein GCM10011379_50590 [Filimonas zeae]